MVPPHSHPFWQMDIALGGRIGAHVEGRRFSLSGGDLLLIAPGSRHRFVFERDGRILSLKFRARAGEPVWPASRLRRSRETSALQGAFSRLLPEDGEPDRLGALLLGDLLVAALHLFSGAELRQEGRPTTSLSERVKESVAALEGRPTSVKALAHTLGFSAGHLAAQFRRGEGVSLKRYLDRERARVAERLLVYAQEMTAAEVSDRLGFPDPFTFSKFCKRTLGRGPRGCRKAARQGAGEARGP